MSLDQEPTTMSLGQESATMSLDQQTTSMSPGQIDIEDPTTSNNKTSLEQLPSEILQRILVLYCEETQDIRDLLNINLLSSRFHAFFKEQAKLLCLVFARTQETTERVILENLYQIRNENNNWNGRELLWLIDGHRRAKALKDALRQYRELGAIQTYCGICHLTSTSLQEQDTEHLLRRIGTLMLGAELCAIETQERQIWWEERGDDPFRLHAASRGLLTAIIALVEAVQQGMRPEPLGPIASMLASSIGEHETIRKIHDGWTREGARWFMRAIARQSFSSMQEFRDCFMQPDLEEANEGPFDLDNLPVMLHVMTMQSSTAQAWDAALSVTRREAYYEWKALVPDEAALDRMLREAGWSVELPDMGGAE